MNSSVTSKLSLVFCLLLLITGCNRIRSISSGNSNGLIPVTTSTNPRGDLTKAMSAMLSAKSYRARMDSSTSNGTKSRMIMEFVAPDRYHLTRESDLGGKGISKQDTIIIGKDTFIKSGDTPWRKFPMNMGDLITQFRDPKVLDELSKGAEIKFIGPDLVNGAPTLVYQYSINLGQNKELKSTAKTWVGVTDSLPRKTESEGDINMLGKQIHTKTNITYSDFNSNIRIEPPM